MRALITGGGGFLGLYLAEELKKIGIEPVLMMRVKKSNKYLDKLGAQIVLADLQDIPSLDQAMKGMDYIFHTAGLISYNPLKNKLMYDTNVIGTCNAADAALRANCKRFIHTSSTAAIGVNEDPNIVLNEDSPFNARALKMAYFDTKYDAELAVIERIKEKGLNAVIVNPGSLMGARDTRRYEQTYPGLIYKYNPRVLFHGGINYVDVRDVAMGHILALEKGRTGERYLLGGENLGFADLIKRTNMLIGRKSPSIYLPKSLMGIAALGLRGLQKLGVEMHITPELVRQVSRWYLYVDSSKAVRELGYRPRLIDESIFQTIKWLKDEGRI